VVSGVMVVLLLIGLAMRKRTGRSSVQSVPGKAAQPDSMMVAPATGDVVPANEPPRQLVLAVDEDPVLALTVLDEVEAQRQTRTLTRCEPAAFGRLLE